MAWRPGKIQALRPVFRDLGLPAAFVYEALEHTQNRVTSFELAQTIGMARSTVYEALHTLVAFNLAQQRGGRWSIVPTTSLAVLAEMLGSTAVIAERLTQHRMKRRHTAGPCMSLPTWRPRSPAEFYDPVTAETETALDVLQRMLGAKRLA